MLGAGVVDPDSFALLCLQIGKKALLPQELHSILDSLHSDLGDNDETRLSEAGLCTFYRLLHIVLHSNRIAKIHGIATTISQLDLCLEPSFQRYFKSGSCIKAFWKYDPWTVWRLHHLDSFVLLLLYREQYNLFEQFDISCKAYGCSRHDLIMARISPSLLYFESFWNGLHPVSAPKLFHASRIIKQGYASVGAQQTGVSVDEHIYTAPRGEIGSTPEQALWR
jgi:hypothetical protein